MVDLAANQALQLSSTREASADGTTALKRSAPRRKPKRRIEASGAII